LFVISRVDDDFIKYLGVRRRKIVLRFLNVNVGVGVGVGGGSGGGSSGGVVTL
jgi:hypothetical protein